MPFRPLCSTSLARKFLKTWKLANMQMLCGKVFFTPSAFAWRLHYRFFRLARSVQPYEFCLFVSTDPKPISWACHQRTHDTVCHKSSVSLKLAEVIMHNFTSLVSINTKLPLEHFIATETKTCLSSFTTGWVCFIVHTTKRSHKTLKVFFLKSQ